MAAKKKEQLQAKAENEKRFMYYKKFLLEKRMTQRDIMHHLFQLAKIANYPDWKVEIEYQRIKEELGIGS